jgi:hypothetical protein
MVIRFIRCWISKPIKKITLEATHVSYPNKDESVKPLTNPSYATIKWKYGAMAATYEELFRDERSIIIVGDVRSIIETLSRRDFPGAPD